MSVLRGTFPAATNAAQHSLARHFSFPAVVGYLGTEFGTDGQVFKAAPLFTIGIKDSEGNDCVRLSDLKVKGYDDLDGCWANVWIDVLKKNGAIQKSGEMDMTYQWFDEDGEYEAGWYDPEETPMKEDQSPLGNAEDITFAVGEGICFNADSDYASCTLECAGQVLQAKSSYVIKTDGQMIAANPLCRAVKLSEITVEGYGDDGLDLGGCWANVWIDILKKNGAIKQLGEMNMTYQWFDEDGEYEAGWYDPEETAMKNDQSPLGNADEIEFAVGEGICVNADSDYVGCTVNFPSLGL